jgi:hypothetical protein
VFKDDDEDPLEAFMFELDASEESVPQESINSLSSEGVASAGVSQTASNSITLEELMGLTSSSNSGQGGEGWESDVKAEMTDDEEDEETQERDRNDFMRAIRSMHGSGGVDYDEDGQSSTPASSSSSAVAAPRPTRGGLSADEDKTSGGGDGKEGGDERTEGTLSSKLGGKATKQETGSLGRIFVDEGDVMEEHEREVRVPSECMYTWTIVL